MRCEMWAYVSRYIQHMDSDAFNVYRFNQESLV